MTLFALMMCLLVTTMAAPALESGSNEQDAAHANQALRWMEMYSLFQKQAVVRNPFLPSADTPVVPAVVDAVPDGTADVPPPALKPVEDASEDETEDGSPAHNAAAPLNSDEVEEAEEVEAAEAEPAVVEAAPVEPTADPAAVVQPAVTDAPGDSVPVVVVAAVDVPPVNVVTDPPAVEGEITGVAADAAALQLSL